MDRGIRHFWRETRISPYSRHFRISWQAYRSSVFLWNIQGLRGKGIQVLTPKSLTALKDAQDSDLCAPRGIYSRTNVLIKTDIKKELVPSQIWAGTVTKILPGNQERLCFQDGDMLVIDWLTYNSESFRQEITCVKIPTSVRITKHYTEHIHTNQVLK